MLRLPSREMTGTIRRLRKAGRRPRRPRDRNRRRRNHTDQPGTRTRTRRNRSLHTSPNGRTRRRRRRSEHPKTGGNQEPGEPDPDDDPNLDRLRPAERDTVARARKEYPDLNLKASAEERDGEYMDSQRSTYDQYQDRLLIMATMRL